MRSIRAVATVIVMLAAGLTPDLAAAANCGGSVVCQCGDTVTSNYTMTSDLGPCPRLADPADTIGLTLKSGVTLDCQGHTISGPLRPGDQFKKSFGVRVGTSSASSQVIGVSITNCGITKFWWGVFVQNARSVHIHQSNLFENGWKDPTQNGTGYGVNVTSSHVIRLSDSFVTDNGNEGFHLSNSTDVTIDGNVLANNGREQLYMFHADDNIIMGNRTEGGTQGLEMRFSNRNEFSFNVWAASPLHMLENDDDDNTFTYDRFEGRVRVGTGSGNNLFQLSEFTNPTGICLITAPDSPPYILKGYFHACATEVSTSAPVTFDRSVNNLKRLPRGVIVKFPGCTADVNLDAVVDATDRQVVQDAIPSAIGDPQFDARADLNHDGVVNADDMDLLNSQFGPCTADLMVTALSGLPALATPGTKIEVTNTVSNGSSFGAGTSRTQFYLALGTSRSSGDKLLGGRPVPALGSNAVSTDTTSLTIPLKTADGSYYLIACADDKSDDAESNETNNCLASSSAVQVGKPDLLQTSVSEPPDSAARGGRFPVTDTVENQGAVQSGASTTRYYLSLGPNRASGDKLLTGTRQVSVLGPGEASADTVQVTIPLTVPTGSYFLIACADDKGAIPESDETNNCLASTSKITVTP